MFLLAGCPTVDLGDSPDEVGRCNPKKGQIYFTSTIWTNFIKHTDPQKACTRAGGCHAQAGGNALNFATDPLDFTMSYKQAQVYLNCGTPEASELLTKPMAGIDAHGGDDLFAPTDVEVMIFKTWFEE
jgi:hypothetical protein